MLQQRLIDFRKALQDGGIGRHLLAQAHERAYHEHAHLHSAVATQDIGGHESAVLGEDPR